MFITQALAEIKTIGKRITAKRGFIRSYMARAGAMVDPLAKDGARWK